MQDKVKVTCEQVILMYWQVVCLLIHQNDAIMCNRHGKCDDQKNSTTKSNDMSRRFNNAEQINL